VTMLDLSIIFSNSWDYEVRAGVLRVASNCRTLLVSCSFKVGSGAHVPEYLCNSGWLGQLF
jgi:hypothetical protein